jgi:hypothetical protein
MRRELISCAVALLLFAISTPAQTGEPASTSFKLKELKVSGFDWIPVVLEWVVTDSHVSIVFARDEIEDTSVTLRSFALSPKGKVSSPNQLLQLTGGYIYDVAAFWIDTPAPREGYGLLFLSCKQWTNRKHIFFNVGRFDSDGRLRGDFTTIYEVDDPQEAGQYLTLPQIKVGWNGDKFGAVLSYRLSTYSSNLSGDLEDSAYFAQFNAEGVLLDPGIQVIKLPKAGGMIKFQPYGPAWNGQSWVVPTVVSQLVVKTDGTPHYTEEAYSQLMALVATPKSSDPADGTVKMKLRRIARDNTPACVPYEGLLFLPRAVAPAKRGGPYGTAVGETLILLYTKAIPIPWQQWNTLRIRKNFSYFIQPVNGKGKKAGAAKPFDATAWQRKYAPDPNEWNMGEHYDYFSCAITGEDGQPRVAQARSAYFYTAEIGRDEYQMETQIDVYAIDPSGTPTLEAQNRFYGISAYWPPLLILFDGKLSIIQACFRTLANGTLATNYFGRF